MLRSLLRRLCVKGLQSLQPDRVLRVLFWLDKWLYYLEGQMAIRYGDGVHTKHRHTGYAGFFAGRIRPGEHVLDVGCGMGAVAYEVAERSGADVVGVDVDPASIAEATQRYSHPRVQYVVGDALEALPDQPFDVVILSNVLEHLPERPAFLQRLRRAVGPSRVLIRVPLFERDWRVPLKRELGVEWRLDSTHQTEYTPESFADEIAAAGFRVIHQEVRWGEIWAEVV